MDEKRLNKQQNYSIKFTLVNSFWKHSIFNDGEQKKKQKKLLTHCNSLLTPVCSNVSTKNCWETNYCENYLLCLLCLCMWISLMAISINSFLYVQALIYSENATKKSPPKICNRSYFNSGLVVIPLVFSSYSHFCLAWIPH